MLTRYQLTLEPDRPCAIGPEWGYRLYAALLSQTPEGFGAALHQNAVTPLSQFVWAEKTGALHWTVSLLGEISEEILSPLLEGVPSLYLERDRVELASPPSGQTGSTTWTSCSPGPPGRRAATPCAFRPPPPLRAGGSM